MKIAYITTSFSSVSHTFIRAEVLELRALGLDISLYGIRPDKEKELLNDTPSLSKKTRYLYPLKILSVIVANFWFILRSPSNYFCTLMLAIFNEERNPDKYLKLIYHFFVAPYIALDMKKNTVRHIHAHFLNAPATIALYSSKLLGITFSLTNHSAGIRTLPEMHGLKMKLKEAEFIRTVSNFNKQYLNGIYPCIQKTYVVRCGINVTDYKLQNLAPEKLIAGDIKLISIGRFVEKKGFRYLIEAAKLLKSENVGFELNIVGDGPLRSELSDSVELYGLDGNIIFKGSLTSEDIKQALAASDIFIAPSVTAGTGEMEGIPVVLMEAMAIGVFVIATEHSGVPEIVKDGQTGLLVPESSAGAIAGAVKLAKADPDLRRKCVALGRELIEKEFNITNTAIQMKKLFDEKINLPH